MVRADGGSWRLGGPVSPSGWGADGAGRARCSGPEGCLRPIPGRKMRRVNRALVLKSPSLLAPNREVWVTAYRVRGPRGQAPECLAWGFRPAAPLLVCLLLGAEVAGCAQGS